MIKIKKKFFSNAKLVNKNNLPMNNENGGIPAIEKNKKSKIAALYLFILIYPCNEVNCSI
jgi:hypothetical protein